MGNFLDNINNIRRWKSNILFKMANISENNSSRSYNMRLSSNCFTYFYYINSLMLELLSYSKLYKIILIEYHYFHKNNMRTIIEIDIFILFRVTIYLGL